MTMLKTKQAAQRIAAKRAPVISDLKFAPHPNQPAAYEYAVIEFPNGEGVSVCKRKKNEGIFPGYGYAVDTFRRTLYNRSVKYEAMRFNKIGERFDNEILTTDRQLLKLMALAANVGKKPKRAATRRKKAG